MGFIVNCKYTTISTFCMSSKFAYYSAKSKIKAAIFALAMLRMFIRLYNWSKISSLLFCIILLPSCKHRHADASSDVVGNKYYYEYSRIYAKWGKEPMDSTRSKLVLYLHQFPESFEGWAFLGSLCISSGDYLTAQECYRKALSLNPNYGPAYTGLAVLYSWQASNDSALIWEKKAIVKGDSSASNYIRLAIMQLKAGDTLSVKQGLPRFSKTDSLDNLSLVFLAALNHALHDSEGTEKLLAALSSRNFRDSLLQLYLNDKMNAVEFFNQKGKLAANGK